jgi:hypothetical protein
MNHSGKLHLDAATGQSQCDSQGLSPDDCFEYALNVWD